MSDQQNQGEIQLENALSLRKSDRIVIFALALAAVRAHVHPEHDGGKRPFFLFSTEGFWFPTLEKVTHFLNSLLLVLPAPLAMLPASGSTSRACTDAIRNCTMCSTSATVKSPVPLNPRVPLVRASTDGEQQRKNVMERNTCVTLRAQVAPKKF